MRFGHFDDAKREYVIETPRTPLPWINYLGSEDFFALVSNTAGGYAFYRDARLRRLTRYRYNNCPLDSDGFHVYVKDGDTVWNPGWQPTQTELDEYECRHGLGYTILRGSKNGIAVRQEMLVPKGDNCLLTRLTVTNESDAPRTVSLFPYAEFCLWDAMDDSSNFQRNFSIGEVELEPNAIYHKTEYRERRDHYAVLWADRPYEGFDTSRDAFIGVYGAPSMPQAVKNGACTGSVAHGWAPVGAMQFTLSLAPGASQTLLLGLGYIENPEDAKWSAPGVINKEKAHAMMERYSSDAAFDRALAALWDHWSRLLDGYQVSSGDEKLDRMVNIWNQYQPLTKKGNLAVGSGFNDDPLWLIAGTDAYLRETGDWTILDEPVPFDTKAGTEQPLLEHLRRSFRYTVDHLGPHGLPLIGRADWNDCLNLNCFSAHPGESFQTTGPSEGPVAESVFIAGMFVKYGRVWADICRHLGLDAEADDAESAITAMEQTVLDAGWDGEWFRRAYDAFGAPVGSQVCEEGRIFIEPQGMCVMAGIGAATGQAAQALASVQRYLDTQYGIVLLHPAYTRYHLELGEITSYPPGYKENAGIFCHNNPWITCAETVLGHGTRAFEVYRKTCPAYIEDISEIHRTEPYVYSQMVAGKDAPTFGEGKNSWLTGTAAWTFVSISQAILGIQPTLDGLAVAPCIPAGWAGYTVKRRYRGAVYRITVENPHHAEKGIVSLTVNGTPVTGNVLPPAAPGTEVRVRVVMG